MSRRKRKKKKKKPLDVITSYKINDKVKVETKGKKLKAKLMLPGELEGLKVRKQRREKK